jgi:hypothetical protein
VENLKRRKNDIPPELESVYESIADRFEREREKRCAQNDIQERTVDDCLEWAEKGDMNAGQRTIDSIKVLAAEVRRLRDKAKYHQKVNVELLKKISKP